MNYRVANYEYVVLCPKFSEYQDKYGKFHASRELLYVEHGAFLVPKASPLHASICDLNVHKVLVP